MASTLDGGTFAPTPSSGERPLLAARYEILALLGAGAMGTVYRAKDLALDELVALKVLKRDLVDAPETLELFRREVKLSRRVTHRNVARVFDIGEHEGDKILTMELVEGESLGAALARDGAFRIPRAVAVARAIAEGLGAAHAAGVVHRDLKPDNVLLEKGGRVVITDFGVARAVAGTAGVLTSLGGGWGTPAYMAPEQIDGHHDIDARADLYALGAVMYEMITGKQAWPGPSPFAPARLQGKGPDPRAAVPDLVPALADLVVRLLSRRREDRPAAAGDVVADLDALDIREPALPAAPPPPSHAAEPALPAESDKTVAVLPFVNAGPAEDAYLAEELTDDLIDALSMTAGLRVRARSTLTYVREAGPGQDARELGLALGVEAIVEGSVRRARGGVRMTVRVLGVADGFQLWAKRWDKSQEEVLAINDEAAKAIAAALGVKAHGPVRAPPEDAAAMDLYLRARHEYRKFWPPSLHESIALFERALAKSPDDPLLLSGMASAISRLAFFEGDTWLPKARAAAERAVAAAPDSGEPRLSLGSVLFQLGDASGAVRALRAAVHRAPGLAEGQSALGRIFAEIGAVDDARRRLSAALLIDPGAPLARPELIRMAALLGRWDEVEERLQDVERDTSNLRRWMQRSRLNLWRRLPFVNELYGEEMARADNPLALPLRLVYALHVHGRLPEGSPDLMAQALAMPGLRGRLFMFQMAAEVHGFLRDTERTLAPIEAAASQGLIDRLWLERCPLLDDVRNEARYSAAHAIVAKRTDGILADYRSP